MFISSLFPLEPGAGLLDDGATTPERLAGEALSLQDVVLELGETSVGEGAAHDLVDNVAHSAASWCIGSDAGFSSTRVVMGQKLGFPLTRFSRVARPWVFRQPTVKRVDVLGGECGFFILRVFD
jgi:hypothetical protein